MVDFSAIWQIGPRIASRILGFSFQQYRPTGSIAAAISAGNLIGTIPAWITGDKNLMAMTPFAYGHPVGYAAIDPAVTQVGDYLVGPTQFGGAPQTFFIASQDVPAPIQVVKCNATLSMFRPAAQNPGSQFYGGDTDETLLFTSWPASVTDKGRRQSGEVHLPGDMDMQFVEILLPASVPAQLLQFDAMVDNMAQPTRYLVSGLELTSLGWRVAARVAGP